MEGARLPVVEHIYQGGVTSRDEGEAHDSLGRGCVEGLDRRSSPSRRGRDAVEKLRYAAVAIGNYKRRWFGAS
jgi:hypothetical protein